MKTIRQNTWSYFGLTALLLVFSAAALLSGCASKLVGVTPLGSEQRHAPGTFDFGPAYTRNPNTARTQDCLQLASADELWLIARSANTTAAPAADDTPGSGTLMTKVKDEEAPIPLKHTE